jgi:stage V sporulation protein B
LFRNMTRPLFASGMMAIAIFVIKQPLAIIIRITNGTTIINGIATLLIISVGGFVYVYFIILIGGIKKNDINSISPRIFNLLPRFLRVKLK